LVKLLESEITHIFAFESLDQPASNPGSFLNKIAEKGGKMKITENLAQFKSIARRVV
jgi:hypothetical protein